MPSIYSHRSISQPSLSTLDHQWDPYQVLDLKRDQRCVGRAHSKGRNCFNTVNRNDKGVFHDIVSQIACQPLDATELHAELHDLAKHGLCLRVHRSSQIEYMIDKWTEKINNAARSAQEEVRTQQHNTHPHSESATELVADTISLSPPIRRITRAPTSTSTESAASPQSEAESIRRSIAAMQATIETALRRLECIESPHTPHMSPVRPLNRVATSEISTAHLSTQSRTSSAVSRSSPARSSSSSTASTSPPDPSSPSSSSSSSRPTPPSHTASSTSTSPLPHPVPQPCPRIHSHTRRLPLQPNSECPICYDSMGPSAADAQTDWCRDGCGQSVHRVCMDVWRALCVGEGREVTCTMCRAAWGSCGC